MSEAGAPKDAQPKGPPSPDPMDTFREMRDGYLTTMAKNMAEVVNTESYAQATGAVLNGYLGISGPFKEALDKSMLQALEQLSLPSRLDIISLAERFTNLEMRLDDMDTKLDGLVRQAAVAASASKPTSRQAASRSSAKKSARVVKQTGKRAKKVANASGAQARRSRLTTSKGSAQ